MGRVRDISDRTERMIDDEQPAMMDPRQRTDAGRHHRTGVWYGIAAYVVWGLSPLFWNLVDGIATGALLVQRIVWALLILALVISLRGLWPTVRSAYAARTARTVTVVAAILLATNWGVFLWAVTNDHVVEASLGYFITPLVSVALGVVVLRERLRPTQWAAVAIASVGVLGMALRVGTVPWVSLTLGFSFGFYGLLKKNAFAAPPLAGLFGETLVLVGPALVLAAASGTAPPGIALTPAVWGFLTLTGVITVVPLLLFGASAQRIPLSTLGMLQYIAPSLQLLVGITVLGEHMTSDTLFGFVLVWIALALSTVDSVRQGRGPAPAAA
jgi:chloramphenicol-sensitive protein RarD